MVWILDSTLVLKMMNVVFLINRIGNISEKISSKESDVIKNILDKILKDAN